MKLFGDISGSSWQGILTQYWDATGYVSSTVTTSAPYTDTATSAPIEIEQVKIRAEVLHAIEVNGWNPTPDSNFAVFPAPGTTYSGSISAGCGYHSPIVTPAGESTYTYMGYAGAEKYSGCLALEGGNLGNAMSRITSHEYAEDVTNPYGEGWALANGELADVCDTEPGGYLAGGSYVQRIYDIYLHQCALSDPNPPQLVKAVTQEATGLTTQDATLRGIVNPGGESATYRFEYGETTGYGKFMPMYSGESIGSGTSDIAVSQAVTGLSPGTTYHFRIVETVGTHKKPGADVVFTTAPSLHAPIASTNPATQVRGKSATLNATVNPNGASAKYQFEYGLNTFYGSKVPAVSEELGSGTKDIAVSKAISGLYSKRIYHYRVVATNSEGAVVYGSDQQFETTSGKPIVGVTAPSEVKSAEATLNGFVNPESSSTTYFFQYGTTTSYGAYATLPPTGIGSGSEDVAVSKTIQGLKPNTTYHFSLVGANAEGYTYGDDTTFTTGQTALTEAATNLKAPKVTLNGSVNPQGLSTTYRFEYGPTAAYGTSVPVPAQNVGSGSADVKVSQQVGNLEPGATYHYRVVAENSEGTTSGKDETFTTAEWAIASTVEPAEISASYLSASSCWAPSECTAVGNYKPTSGPNLTLAERRSGGTWSIQTTPNPAEASLSILEGVSCTSASSCMAVGFYRNSSLVKVTLAERWNGSAWSIQTTPNPATAQTSFLESVSCVSATDCTAVGYYTTGSEAASTLVEHYNGSTWSIVSSPNPSGFVKSYLHSVSCVSATDCWAVGQAKHTSSEESGGKKPQALVEHYNGSTWSIVSLPEPPADLTAISCSASSWCVAANGENMTLQRYDGAIWATQSAPEPPGGSAGELSGVSCTSASACTAVGQRTVSGHTAPLAEHWNSAAWSPQSATDPVEGISGSTEGTLLDVSCKGSSACTAVGNYKNSSAQFRLLGEAHG